MCVCECVMSSGSASCLYFVFICITVCSSIVNFSYLLFEFALLLTVDLNKEHSADLNHDRPVPTHLSP